MNLVHTFYQGKLKENHVYLFKLLVLKNPLDKNSLETIQADFILSSSSKDVVVYSNEIKTLTSPELTIAKKGEFFEKHVFVTTSLFINQVRFSLVYTSAIPQITVSKIELDLSPKKLIKLRDSIQTLNKLKRYNNKQKVMLVHGGEKAIQCINSLKKTTKPVHMPSLNANHELQYRKKPFENKLIGFIGDQLDSEMIGLNYNCVNINELSQIKLIEYNVFDLIIYKKNSCSYLPFGISLQHENKFFTSLIKALAKTSTPVLQSNPATDNAADNSTYLVGKKPIEHFHLFHLCNFYIPNKNRGSLAIRIFIPTASDLYQTNLFYNLCLNAMQKGYQIIISESYYDHTVKRTTELFPPLKNVKIYPKLSASSLVQIASQCSHVLLPNSRHSIKKEFETLNLCALAIMSGSIPVIFDSVLPTPLGLHISTISSFCELQDKLISESHPLSFQKSWMRLFRVLSSEQIHCNATKVVHNLLQELPPNEPRVTPSAVILCVSKRPDNIEIILKNFRRQTYTNLSLSIIFNISLEEKIHFKNHHKEITKDKNINIDYLDTSNNIGSCLNFGINKSINDYWFKMDDDDYYGKHYIFDLMCWYRVTKADVIGKPSAMFLNKSDNQFLIRSTVLNWGKFITAGYICGGTLSAIKHKQMPLFSTKSRNGCDSLWVECVRESNLNVFSADNLNHLIYRGDPNQHTWRQTFKTLKTNALTDYQFIPTEEWLNE